MPSNPFAGSHHARYLRPDVPVHIISRVTQGRCLLTPCPEFNLIMVGAVARGLEHWRTVRLYALAVLSNHMHAMVSGDAPEVAAFIGFVKREVSRRWGPKVGWEGTMWDEYISTALPTAESQVNCLRYILAQGVKENLVERPEHWPGVHCARSLMTGVPLKGTWLDATAYGRARQRAASAELAARISRARYQRSYELTFSPIPAWDCAPKEYRERVRKLVEHIVAERVATYGAKPALGVKKILRTSKHVRRSMPRPPWFEHRRRMVCWASPSAPETKEYLRDYWAFQRAFRFASNEYLAGHIASGFPPGAFLPMVIARPPPPTLAA